MPPALARRPQWKGMPVPYTTLISNETGEPNFKVTDRAAWLIALADKLCALCGEALPYWVWYIGSAEHVSQEIVFDLAMHFDCAQWACLSCPYIALGKAYGNTIKPSPGAQIQELCPRSALSNEGVPLFLFKARRDSAKAVYSEALQIQLAKTGPVVESHPIARRAEVVRNA